MAQRLGQGLDVGYRPLTPADDVAGLAGQKQAVDEFTALSTDQARKAAAAQAAAELMVKQQIEQAKIMNQARQIGVSAMNAATGAASQRARASAANQELMMQHRMLPMKMEALDLANQSKSIDNAYAIERGRAEIDGMYLDNETQALDNAYAGVEREAKLESTKLFNQTKENELSKFRVEQTELAKIGPLQAELQQWVDDGNRVSDFPNNPVFKSEAARKAWDEVVADEEKTTDAQRREVEQKAQEARFGKLNQKQMTMMGKTDAMGEPKIKGDIREAIVDRLARMNTEGLLPSDKNMFMEDVRGGSTRLGERWGDMMDGVLVLTEAGLAEQKRLNEARKPKMQVIASEDVFHEGKKAGVKVSRKAVAHTRAERIGEIYKELQTQVNDGTITARQASQLATQREVEENTLHIGVGQSEKDLGTITRHHAQQKRVIRWFQDGTSKIVTPSGGYASTGAPATDTDEPAADEGPDQESASLSDAEVASNIREKYNYRKPNPRERAPDLKNPITLVTARMKSKREEIKSNNEEIDRLESLPYGDRGRKDRDRKRQVSTRRNINIRLSEEIKEAKDDLEMLRRRAE